MTALTVEDQLLIKALQTVNGWIVEKMTVEFPARQCKWYMPLHIL